jgi:hypothetical protein
MMYMYMYMARCRDGMCVNEVGDYTERERGAACRACRFVGIAGAASVRFDASITTEVAYSRGFVRIKD